LQYASPEKRGRSKCPQIYENARGNRKKTPQNAASCQDFGDKKCHPAGKRIEVSMMKKRGQEGFSLIELLIVVAIVALIAVIAIPYLQKGVRAAENGTTFATMRSIASTQMNFFSMNNRFGRLAEINNLLSNSIGTPSGNEVIRGKFVLSMTPASPTDAELRNGYTVTATRNVAGEGVIYVYELTQSGEIRQILP
jgi:prepilin-type N-terminal cleavage/methylation domain-containing protein